MRRTLPSFLGGFLVASLMVLPAARAEDIAPCAVPDTTAAVVDSGATAPVPVAADTAELPLPTTDAVAELPATVPYAAAPRFNELLPDPSGDDAAEFMEFRNSSGAAIDLAGWKIADAKGNAFIFAATSIGAGALLSLTYPETKLRQVNTGSAFTLFDPNGAVRDTVTYGSPVPTGKSWSFVGGVWQWVAPTPGEANAAPIAAAITVVQTTATTQTSVVAGDSVQTASVTTTVPVIVPAPAVQLALTALLPNPDGDDVAEWMEIRNDGATTAALDGWSIADAANVTFHLNGKTLDAGATLRIMKADSRISLNNTEEDVRLISPSGTVRETVHYEDAPSGVRFIKDAQGAWHWDVPAPVIAPMPVAATAAAPASPADSTGSGDAGGSGISIADLDGLEDGDSVTVRAVVTAPPGMFGKTSFAVRDTAADAGALVRVYGSGALPAMHAGDTVLLTARLKRDGVRRLATTVKEIAMLGDAPHGAPVDRAPGDVTMEDAGLAVMVHGAVAARGKRWIAIGDDTGTSEIIARLVSGEMPAAIAGDAVTALGVVRPLAKGLEITVAKASDMQIAAADTGTMTNAATDAGQAVVRTAPSLPELPAQAVPHPWTTAGLLTSACAAGLMVWKKRQGLAGGIEEL